MQSVTSLAHLILLGETTSWAWSWNALVALGTIGLALGTVWLAWSTRSSVRAARDEQSAAWRPVLVVRPESSSISMAKDCPTGVEFNVSNEGRGPALMIDATLSYSIHLDRKEVRASRVGVLPANRQRSVAFPLPGVALDRFVELKVTYVDLAQRRYWSNSVAGIDIQASPPQVEAVMTYFQNGGVGDLVPPRPGRVASRLILYRHRRKVRIANDRARAERECNRRGTPTKDSAAHAQDAPVRKTP